MYIKVTDCENIICHRTMIGGFATASCCIGKKCGGWRFGAVATLISLGYKEEDGLAQLGYCGLAGVPQE